MTRDVVRAMMARARLAGAKAQQVADASPAAASATTDSEDRASPVPVVRGASQALPVVSTATSDLTGRRLQVAGLPGEIQLFLSQTRECIAVDLFRPAIVMAWMACIGYMQAELASKGLSKLVAAKKGWGHITSVADLRESVPDFQLIDAAKDIRWVRKTEAKQLHGLLNTRNMCAHPGDYVPTEHNARGYLSDVVQMLGKLTTRPV